MENTQNEESIVMFKIFIQYSFLQPLDREVDSW